MCLKSGCTFVQYNVNKSITCSANQLLPKFVWLNIYILPKVTCSFTVITYHYFINELPNSG